MHEHRRPVCVCVCMCFVCVGVCVGVGVCVCIPASRRAMVEERPGDAFTTTLRTNENRYPENTF